jgi:hypothetical protein
MASPDVTVRFSAEDNASPKLRALHRRICLVAVVQTHKCPQCRAQPGEPCKSASGKPAPPHILRTNLAKREAAPGLCPLGCGDRLQIIKHNISHELTGLFDCNP